MDLQRKTWKKSTRQGIFGFERATLTHRQDHPVADIIRAVNTTPIMSRPINFGMEIPPGQVSVHPYGEKQIVVRWLNDGNWVRKIFRKVESARKRESGFDEEHIAFIQPHGESKAALVTLVLADEKNKMLPTLKDYFNNHQNPKERLLEVGIQAMKKLAEFHASGFSHGHPNRENILIESPNVVRLIDPKDLTRLYRIGKQAAGTLREKDRNELAEHILDLLDDRKEFIDEQIDAFSDKLDEEYAKHYQHSKEKIEKKVRV
ncbi:hypothetical protein HY994_01825 [Candidatus Micrarchaeota archaeon]|nr:hypothetical protein [Candidatus Micrarchaeota archaeon]